MIAKIDETLTVMEHGKDIPDWAKLPLYDGLTRLRFTLQHLLFFGCESAIDLLLEVYNKASAIGATLDKGESTAKEPGSRTSTMIQILNCLVLAANVFWLPDQASTAFERYQGWYLKLIVENPRLPKPETRLLAPPASTDDPGEDETPTQAAIEPKLPEETLETRN